MIKIRWHLTDVQKYQKWVQPVEILFMHSENQVKCDLLSVALFTPVI